MNKEEALLDFILRCGSHYLSIDAIKQYAKQESRELAKKAFYDAIYILPGININMDRDTTKRALKHYFKFWWKNQEENK